MKAIIEKIKEYKIIVICAGLGLALGGFFLLKPSTQKPVTETNLQAEVAAVSKDSSSEKEIKKEEKDESAEQDLITVDVKGAVKSPGIYDLPVGSRVHDAVQKAGGLTEEAASQQISSGTTPSTSKEKKVNLNKASLEELKQVKGLGGKRAQDIIDHREANGKFKSVDELKKVSGIGAKTIEKLKDYVTVD